MDSILTQTLTEFEVICINDGSTDQSKEILKQYVQSDSRVQLIEQKNQGASAARNRGIERALGEYIAFVDADDWVEPDYLEWLYETARRENVLMTICGYDIDGVGVEFTGNDIQQGILTQELALQYALMQVGYQGFLWNKLFHRSLFYEKGIRLDTSLFVLEDLFCVCKCVCHIAFVYYEPVVKYHYNQVNGMTFQLNEKSQSMFIAAQKLIDLFSKEKNETALLYAKNWHCYSAGALYLYYKLQENQEKADFYYREQKRYLKEYLKINKSQSTKLARGLMIAYCPKLAIWMKKRAEKSVKNVSK